MSQEDEGLRCLFFYSIPFLQLSEAVQMGKNNERVLNPVEIINIIS